MNWRQVQNAKSSQSPFFLFSKSSGGCQYSSLSKSSLSETYLHFIKKFAYFFDRMAVNDEGVTDIATERKGRSQTLVAVKWTKDLLTFRVVGNWE